VPSAQLGRGDFVLKSGPAKTAADRPRVLVSILNYNSLEHTIEAIESFRAQTYPNMHLQMIDNASTTDCVPRIRARFPDLDVVAAGSNLGYTGGNNLALERGVAEGFDHVLVCNEDIVVAPDAVTNLVETAEANRDAGVVGGVEVDYESGTVRTTGGRRFPDWRCRFRWPVDPAPEVPPWTRVLYVQGALVLFTGPALALGVRFDDRLFIYWDEIELGYELKERGLAAYVDHRVAVRHRNKPGSFSIRSGYLQQRNRAYLAAKRFSRSKSWLYLAYSSLVEVPLKAVVRTFQGHPRFALACLLGQWDGLTGRMGKGRLESFHVVR
jgi:GT2 family glycosyltransferase